MKIIMKKRNSRFEETKREKFINKIKEKRFYIVLLCCIMAVSATYFVVNSFVKPSEPQRLQSNTLKVSPTPLPDLTKNFPRETPQVSLKPSAAPKEKTNSVSSKNTPVPTASAKPAAVSEANAPVEVEYKMREKSALSYPVSGEIITPHATESLIYSKTLGDWRSHTGIDIKAQAGTEVAAADDGVIADIYTDDFMGIVIVIDHQNGRKTLYANLSNSNLVQNGQEIRRGDIISAIGDTAVAESGDESHLHFEAYEDGAAIDPLTVLQKII